MSCGRAQPDDLCPILSKKKARKQAVDTDSERTAANTCCLLYWVD